MDPKAVSQRVFKERTVLYNWGDGVSEEMQKKYTTLTFHIARTTSDKFPIAAGSTTEHTWSFRWLRRGSGRSSQSEKVYLNKPHKTIESC